MVVKSGGVNAAKKLEEAEKKKEKDVEGQKTNFHKNFVTQNHMSGIVNITNDEDGSRPEPTLKSQSMSQISKIKDKEDKTSNNVIIELSEENSSVT
jgi:hypothetical protein